MRVSKEKAAENRVALLQAASRLFRKRGIDGVGVADIAEGSRADPRRALRPFPIEKCAGG